MEMLHIYLFLGTASSDIANAEDFAMMEEMKKNHMDDEKSNEIMDDIDKPMTISLMSKKNSNKAEDSPPEEPEFHDMIMQEVVTTSTEESYPFPTLEPGFTLLSDDWFKENTIDNADNKQQSFNDSPPEEPMTELSRSVARQVVSSRKSRAKPRLTSKVFKPPKEEFMLYYPISGSPFFSFRPSLELASIVKK